MLMGHRTRRTGYYNILLPVSGIILTRIMRVWWGHLDSSGRSSRIRVQECKGLKGSSHVTPSWNRWENGILERDVDLSGNDMACGCFIPALSHSQERHVFWGAEGGAALEKVNGFQLYVEGFWVQEFRGQSTSLVPEFQAPGSALSRGDWSNMQAVNSLR